MLISLISFGSSQTLRLPHFNTLAARRSSSSETLIFPHATLEVVVAIVVIVGLLASNSKGYCAECPTLRARPPAAAAVLARGARGALCRLSDAPPLAASFQLRVASAFTRWSLSGTANGSPVATAELVLAAGCRCRAHRSTHLPVVSHAFPSQPRRLLALPCAEAKTC